MSTKTLLSFFLGLVVAAGATAQGSKTDASYLGTCEASAAVMLEPGLFVVGDAIRVKASGDQLSAEPVGKPYQNLIDDLQKDGCLNRFDFKAAAGSLLGRKARSISRGWLPRRTARCCSASATRSGTGRH